MSITVLPDLTQAPISPEEFERVVDTDLDAFDVWFKEHVETTGGIGIIKPERAILKTYLWYKTHPGQTPKPIGG